MLGSSRTAFWGRAVADGRLGRPRGNRFAVRGVAFVLRPAACAGSTLMRRDPAGAAWGHRRVPGALSSDSRPTGSFPYRPNPAVEVTSPTGGSGAGPKEEGRHPGGPHRLGCTAEPLACTVGSPSPTAAVMQSLGATGAVLLDGGISS